MTWNLWWRYGDWERREKAIRSTLKTADADIIGLQEVWSEKDRNQAEILADELGFEWVYKTGLKVDDVEFGNAILSRWPIKRTVSSALPSASAGEKRTALFSEIESPRGIIPFTTTHLTWERHESATRQRQAQAVVELISKEATGTLPPILCGDFNAAPTSDEIRMITGEREVPVPGLAFQDCWAQAGDGTPGVTYTPESKHFPGTRRGNGFTMPWLGRRLDYIFVALPDAHPEMMPVHVDKCSIVGRGETQDDEGSDHYGVVADLSPHLLK